MLTDVSALYMQVSASHMRKVLEAFREGRKVPPSPLKLLIPRQYRSYSLSYAEHHSESLAADAALMAWINIEITKELTRRRRHHNLKLPKKRSSRSEAIVALTLDLYAGSEELALWGLLYYLYVRVDVELSIEELTRIMYCDERTVRRRREKALRRLAHQLLRNVDHSSE
jgi:hypothetical protein